MYQAAKVHQVAKEMKRLRLAILGVSETRWTGAGEVHFTTGETVLYSGLAGYDAPLKMGVALILPKEAGKSLKEWEPISLLGLSLNVRTLQSSKCMHQRTMLKRK